MKTCEKILCRHGWGEKEAKEEKALSDGFLLDC